MAVGGEFGGVALPQGVLPLPADREVVADPEIALAVEHRLAACAITPAVELERQHPRARREVEIRHVGYRAHRLVLRDRIEGRKQRKNTLRLIPGIARDRFGGGQRIAWRGSCRRRRGGG